MLLQSQVVPKAVYFIMRLLPACLSQSFSSCHLPHSCSIAKPLSRIAATGWLAGPATRGLKSPAH